MSQETFLLLTYQVRSSNIFRIIRTFISNSTIFIMKAILVNNLLTLGILFSTSPFVVLEAVLVTNLLTS